MGDLNPFKKPKQDTSALDEQKRKLDEQEKQNAAQEKAQKEKEAKKRKASLQARQGQRGSRSLLSGLETGIDAGKRGTLG